MLFFGSMHRDHGNPSVTIFVSVNIHGNPFLTLSPSMAGFPAK